MVSVFSTSGVLSQSAIESQYPPAPDNPTAPIQTDHKVYMVERTPAGHAVSIPFVYTNEAGRKVCLPTCNGVHPPALEKWVQGAWITAYGSVVRACLQPPEVVAPGKAYCDTFEIHAHLRGLNRHPQFAVLEVPGRYRLIWDIYETWTPNDPEVGLAA